MIPTLIVLIAAFALLSFVYENCVAPEFRTDFEYQFFELRDQLRHARREEQIIDEESYEILTENLNNALQSVRMMDYVLVLSEVRFLMKKDDAHLKARVETLNRSQDPTIKKIRKGMRVIAFKGVLLSCGILMAHIFPFAAAWLLGKELILSPIRRFLSLPEEAVSIIANARPAKGQAVCA